MGKLVYTSGSGYNMSDWMYKPIEKVYAGRDCVMAKTVTGEIIQKVTLPEIAARTEYWTRIKDIAISKFYSGAAIGLVSDGTCMISKRPLRYARLDIDRINSEVKSWKNITQVAASDAFFALDNMGHVHYTGFSAYAQNDYREVTQWQNIVKLVPGTQSSIFGITSDGKVLAAGGGCLEGPHGNVNKKLNKLNDVIDLFPTGSECETIIFCHSDGSISSSDTCWDLAECKVKDPYRDLAGCKVKIKRLDGYFAYHIVGLTTDNSLIYIMGGKTGARFGTPVFNVPISDSFAVDGDGNVFAISK